MKISMLSLFALFFCGIPSNGIAKKAKNAHVQAVITQVKLLSVWEHYGNGSFRVFDSITFQIDAPSSLKGKKLTVQIPSSRHRKGAATWKKGTVCRFSINGKWLASRASMTLFWGALLRFRIVSKARKP